MKKNYELVCVIESTLAGKDIDVLKAKIEKEITILAVDDMGLLPLAYPLRGQTQAYFISYHVQIDATVMAKVSTMLTLEKGVAKYVFYAMKEQEAFLKYSDLKKSYTTIKDEEEAAKMNDTPVKEESVEEDNQTDQSVAS